MKLTALKRLRYPRGPGGKEYEIGQDFVALSERDAKALTLVRAAKPAVDATDKPRSPKVEPKVLTATAAGDAGDETPKVGRRKYMRRDMQAKE